MISIKLIEKLDGPEGDPILDAQCNVIGKYQGIVIGTQVDLVDGDWERIIFDDGTQTEQRFYAPVESQPAPNPPTQVTPPQISQADLAVLIAAIPIIQKLVTAQ